MKNKVGLIFVLFLVAITPLIVRFLRGDVVSTTTFECSGVFGDSYISPVCSNLSKYSSGITPDGYIVMWPLDLQCSNSIRERMSVVATLPSGNVTTYDSYRFPQVLVKFLEVQNIEAAGYAYLPGVWGNYGGEPNFIVVRPIFDVNRQGLYVANITWFDCDGITPVKSMSFSVVYPVDYQVDDSVVVDDSSVDDFVNDGFVFVENPLQSFVTIGSLFLMSVFVFLWFRMKYK